MLNIEAHKLEPQDVQNEINSGGAFFFGKDKKNNTSIIIKVKQRIPGKIPIEETKNFLVFLLREAMKRADSPGMSGKITIIWDR